MELIGTYQTRRDPQDSYDYAVTWSRRGDVISWRAKVRQHGELVGEPNGTISTAPHDDALAETAVRQAVESSIEDRIQMK